MKDGLKTKADSLAYVDKLKALFDKDQTNDVILEWFELYVFFQCRWRRSRWSILDGAIAKNPKNFVALANKGMMYIQKNDADNAIKCLKQAL